MKKKTISQISKVREHLEDNRSLTSMDAFELYGITRLSAVIFDLRHTYGLKIDSVNRTIKNRYGNTTTYSEYVLRKGE